MNRSSTELSFTDTTNTIRLLCSLHQNLLDRSLIIFIISSTSLQISHLSNFILIFFIYQILSWFFCSFFFFPSQAESTVVLVQNQLNTAESSRSQLEQDNIALYSKIRYLQSLSGTGTQGSGQGMGYGRPSPKVLGEREREREREMEYSRYVARKYNLHFSNILHYRQIFRVNLFISYATC